MTDRTTKLLLALIVLALWALLLRPVLTPVPTRAAEAQIQGGAPAFVLNGFSYPVHNGNIFQFDPSLNLKVRAMQTATGLAPPTYRRYGP